MVRDLDLAALEVVVDGLPLFGGGSTGCGHHAGVRSPCERVSPKRAAHTDGVALTAARRRKEATYPELWGVRGRARLVVLAVEVGAGGRLKPSPS